MNIINQTNRKKSKLLIFLVGGISVEEIEAEEIDLDFVENLKTNIAIIKGVSFDDVEVETKDILVLDKALCSDTLVMTKQGTILFKPMRDAFGVKINGIRPAMNINTESGMGEFLSLLEQKNIIDAFTFVN